MIAITVQMEAQFEFTQGHLIVRNVRCNDNYEPLSDFFQQCIDQKWVFNTCKHTYSDDMSYTTTTYFAVDHAQADKFITAFSDMSAEFSIKKFWSELSHQLTVTKAEIDFTLEEDLLTLVDPEQQILWGQQLPVEETQA